MDRPDSLIRTPRHIVPLLALLAATAAASETPSPAGEWDVETAERELELWRHERLMARRAAPDAALAPFSTDGCSGGMSAAWALAARLAPGLAELHGERPPWEDCCVLHDRAYHSGGGAAGDAPPDARASFEARQRADVELRACVIASRERQAELLAEKYGIDESSQASIYEAIAALMYRAVRIGGVPCTGLPWRWGYGWPECG